MQTDLEALLVLQADDIVINGLEARLAALEPRIRELDQRRQRSLDAVARSSNAVMAEEKKQAYVREKIAEHKQLIERNQAQMDAVTNMKMATAAVAQMEQARRIVATEESDLLVINRKLDEVRAVLHQQQADLAAIEAEQETARAEVMAERAVVDGELAVARGKRAISAGHAPAALVAKYDRIRSRKRTEAVFAMRGMSCGNCDTSIPMQRRHVVTAAGVIELCEACGVLMYYEG